MNNQVTIRLAERFAQRLARQAGSDIRRQVVQANLLAFAAEPSESDIAAALAFIEDQQQYFTQLMPTEKPGDKPAEKEPEDLTPAEQALALYCQALLSTNRFLYID